MAWNVEFIDTAKRQLAKLDRNWQAAAGYTAVWATEKTREAIWDAMYVPNATSANSIGAPELIRVWQDPGFDPTVPSFYYARIIQIPTPRWTAQAAKRFKIEMADEVPMTVQ